MWHIFSAGQVDYAQGLALQEHARALVSVAPGEGFLLSLEHPPTLTRGRRSAPGEVLLSPEELARRGIVVHTVNRGGLVTAHEPGQVVIYPVVSLSALGLSASAYMAALESALLAALTGLGADVFTRPGHRGIFSPQGKTAAMGVSVKDGVTQHGVSVNVANTLAAFSAIVPCGLSDTPITTLTQMGLAATPAQVAQAVLSEIMSHLPL